VGRGGAGKRRWFGGRRGEPAVVDFIELWNAACRLALTCGCKRPQVDSATASSTDRGGPTSGNLLARVLAYLDKCDTAVSGQNGHGDAYWPARAVCWGFDLGEEEGFRILWTYFNPRCRPLWSEKELRHKCRDANNKPFS